MKRKNSYKKMAELLESKLSKEEFMELYDLVDSDPNGFLYDELAEIAAKLESGDFILPGEDPFLKIEK